MSDFDLFDSLNFNSLSLEEKPVVEEKQLCNHSNVSENDGTMLCTDCGEEIGRTINQEKEWRFYGASDSKHTSDPNRCQTRKTDEKSIFKDVESMGFSDKIISSANKIYMQVTGGKIYRGDSRKAIIFACIFHAYKLSGHPQTCETLIEIFSLDRKTGLKGLKHVNLNAPKSSLIHTTYITPANLVEEIMDKFGATDAQKTEVCELYEQIKNKSSKLNRSRPQSVAAGLTYYWIWKNGKNITIKDFIGKVNLSELTVSKIFKEIERIL
jgi:transcription initiation factor TFIIIB Brf1 subunit/transcription initiation factor TFIIB